MTSILIKIFERLVRLLTGHIEEVEDATVTLIHLLVKHLEGKGSHFRLLFVDFSSAFNTIQPCFSKQVFRTV